MLLFLAPERLCCASGEASVFHGGVEFLRSDESLYAFCEVEVAFFAVGDVFS